MGVVYEAKEPHPGRRVVLKICSSGRENGVESSIVSARFFDRVISVFTPIGDFAQVKAPQACEDEDGYEFYYNNADPRTGQIDGMLWRSDRHH